MVLPSAWKERLGNLDTIETVDCETATQQLVKGDIRGPVEIKIEGFCPIYSEVLFLDMSPTDGIYEPLIGYIVLEQAQAAVDMLRHRLLHVGKVDLKRANVDVDMRSGNSRKVLMDNCIVSISDTMREVFKEKKLDWGDSIQKVEILGYKRKPLPDENEIWRRNQIECLPTIGRLAREKIISLYTYSELQFEGWKRGRSFNIGNILSNVEINKVYADVERSYFSSMEIGNDIKTEQLIEFCKFLLTEDIEKLAKQLAEYDYPNFLLDNLRGVQRFRDLCKGLYEKQFPDAFHLWTAEANGIEFFLTIDRKFIHVMTKIKKISLPCRPLSPCELLQMLRIEEKDSFEYKEDQFYDFFGRPA